MNTRLKGRDFITLRDYTREDLETILHTAFDLKAKTARGEPHLHLLGKELGMLFFNPSTRTRISFETAMSQLGGHAQFYAPEHLHAFYRESWEDTGEVLARYLQGILVRLYRVGDANMQYGEAHGILETLAKSASVPIINGSDGVEHPCQAMADVMTIMEKFGADYCKKKIAFVWVPHTRVLTPGVTHSLALACGKLGMNMVVAYPPECDPDPKYIEEAQRFARVSGGSIEVVHDLNEAVKGADVIYTKNWGSITKSEQENKKLQEVYKNWCVTTEHFRKANPGAIYMDAMPVARNIDASSDVVDGQMSVMYDQAENRLHAQKAILSLIM